MCAWRAERLVACGALALLTTALGCARKQESHERVVQTTAPQFQKEPILPLPAEAAAQPAGLVELGGRLFHDPGLSGDGTLACSSCHDLSEGGDDGRRFSKGAGGKLGAVNAPSVLNAGFNFVQFWDGRAATLEEQVGGPLTDPLEMAGSWQQVLAKLRADESYSRAFAGLFADGVTEANVRTAIAAFERTLTTPGSRFDRWLAGERSLLTEAEASGYERFKTAGCIACHQGRNVGGNMFQRFGVMGDYFADRGNVTKADYGRYNVTKQEQDRHVFRVPSLRNVELTAPYFHDGSAETLEQAVRVMAKYQLGRVLPEQDLASIVLFLKTLTGQKPELSRFVAAGPGTSR